VGLPKLDGAAWEGGRHEAIGCTRRPNLGGPDGPPEIRATRASVSFDRVDRLLERDLLCGEGEAAVREPVTVAPRPVGARGTRTVAEQEGLQARHSGRKRRSRRRWTVATAYLQGLERGKKPAWNVPLPSSCAQRPSRTGSPVSAQQTSALPQVSPSRSARASRSCPLADG
jgi:hypothetical protein